MYVGHLKKLVDTPAAVVITVEGLDLLGRGDRKVYLPKSQIQIKSDPIRGLTICIPDWLIIKNKIPWGAVTEIDVITPDPKYSKFKRLGGRNYDYN